MMEAIADRPIAVLVVCAMLAVGLLGAILFALVCANDALVRRAGHKPRIDEVYERHGPEMVEAVGQLRSWRSHLRAFLLGAASLYGYWNMRWWVIPLIAVAGALSAWRMVRLRPKLAGLANPPKLRPLGRLLALRAVGLAFVRGTAFVYRDRFKWAL